MTLQPKIVIPVLAIAGIALVFYALRKKSKTTPRAYWRGPKRGYLAPDNTRVGTSTLNRPPVSSGYGTGMGIGGTGFWTSPGNFDQESQYIPFS